jgi:hypothetical protein
VSTVRCVESLIAVVVLEAEVDDVLVARLSSRLGEKQVSVSRRVGHPGVALLSRPMSDLSAAMGLVNWMVSAAGSAGLDDALVVEACAHPVSTVLRRAVVTGRPVGRG